MYRQLNEKAQFTIQIFEAGHNGQPRPEPPTYIENTPDFIATLIKAGYKDIRGLADTDFRMAHLLATHKIDMALLYAGDVADAGQALEAARNLAHSIENKGKAAQLTARWQGMDVALDMLEPYAEQSEIRNIWFDLNLRHDTPRLSHDWMEKHANLPQQWRYIAKIDGQQAAKRAMSLFDIQKPEHLRAALNIAYGAGDFAWVDELLTRLGRDVTSLDHAQRAIEAGQGDAALAHLDRLPNTHPSQWPPRRQVLFARACLASNNHRRAQKFLAGARSLHARHGFLQSLWLTARLRSDDWNVIEYELTDFDIALNPETRIRGLLRLGNINAAREMLDRFRRTLPAGFAPLWKKIERDFNDISAMPCEPLSSRPQDHAITHIQNALLTGHFDHAKHHKPAAFSDINTARPLILKAQLAFFEGQINTSLSARAALHDLKSSQLQSPAPPELRDHLYNRAASTMRAHKLNTLRPPPGDTLENYQQFLTNGPVMASCQALAAYALQVFLKPDFHPPPRNTTSPIPKTILFYWEGAPSRAVQRTIEAWQHHLPDHETLLFDREAAREFIQIHAQPEDVARFDRIDIPAMASDFFRLIYIHTRGGIYADIDEYPYKNMAHWFSGAGCILQIEAGHAAIANNFFAATPAHPVIATALDIARHNLDHCADIYAWLDTGPGVIGQALVTYIAQENGVADLRTGMLRILHPSAYRGHVATNLNLPHKFSEQHWR